MTSWQEFRGVLALVLASYVAATPAHALVALNEGHDRIFVNASVSVSRDSNVFANSDNRGDYVYSSSLSAEYTRRAGWIGVNANASVGSSHFATIKGQDFNNPSLGLEFTKQTGRTTGSLTFSGSKESRADAAVNVRSTSWNIPIGLNFKYPISGTYTLAGSLGYSSRRYLDENAFASLKSYSASMDLLHILTTERDLIMGYRYRYSETSKQLSSTDHNFSLGLNGKIIRGVNGGLRVGYQTRISNGPGHPPPINSWTVSAPVSFPFGSKKLNLSGSLSKDLSFTPTGGVVDTTNANFDTKYAFNSHWSAVATLAFGDSRFLGDAGRVLVSPGPPPVFGPHRHDDYITWSASLNYSMNEHFKASISYSWFKNWSTISYGDFVRSSWTMTASSRW